ncbi:MAG: hypothetical protein QM791_23145 [Ferruginibacter sp.]
MPANEIQEYIELNQKNFQEIGAGWMLYVERMIGEMMQAGLDQSIELHMKQKYAEFRCWAIAKDDSKRPVLKKLSNIIVKYERLLNRSCEECGRPGHKTSMNGWDMVLCPAHDPDRAALQDRLLMEPMDHNSPYTKYCEKWGGLLYAFLKKKIEETTTLDAAQVKELTRQLMYEVGESFSFNLNYESEDDPPVTPLIQFGTGDRGIIYAEKPADMFTWDDVMDSVVSNDTGE